MLVARIVLGLMATVAIIMFLATVMSLVYLVAAAALVAATRDFLHRFELFCYFRSFVLYPYWSQPNGIHRIDARREYAPTCCFPGSLRLGLERQLDGLNPYPSPNAAATAAVWFAWPFFDYLVRFLKPFCLGLARRIFELLANNHWSKQIPVSGTSKTRHWPRSFRAV